MLLFEKQEHPNKNLKAATLLYPAESDTQDSCDWLKGINPKQSFFKI